MGKPAESKSLRFRVEKNKTRLLRYVYKRTRPSSYPFISGDGFRLLANHVYDETTRDIAPQRIGEGQLVFVQTDYLRSFFRDVDPKINGRYKLITHNSDTPVDEALIILSSEKVSAWFAQNVARLSPKVVPIPIGLENLHHYNLGIPAYFRQTLGQHPTQVNRILVAFSVHTNAAERQAAYENAMQNPLAATLPSWPGQKDYLLALASYRFVVAPPGNGLDTHRIWEALYLGVIPIVKESVAMRTFADLGLPLWVLSDWKELLTIGERELNRKYEQLMDKFSAPPLFMDYWRDRILCCGAAI